MRDKCLLFQSFADLGKQEAYCVCQTEDFANSTKSCLKSIIILHNNYHFSGYCISEYKNYNPPAPLYINKSWRQFFASWLELEDRSLYPKSKFQLDCLSKFLLLVKKLSQVVGCFQETFSIICMYYHTGIAYIKVFSLVAKKNKSTHIISMSRTFKLKMVKRSDRILSLSVK